MILFMFFIHGTFQNVSAQKNEILSQCITDAKAWWLRNAMAFVQFQTSP